MLLSATVLAALENLHQKKLGVEVNWINIADARALTELGLASRGLQGWTITEAGSAAYSAQPPLGHVTELSARTLPPRS